MRLLVPVLLGLAACGTPALPPPAASPDVAIAPDVPSADSVAPDDSPPPLDAPPPDGAASPVDANTPSPSPAGPYGSAVGQVVADLAWEGYVNEAHDQVSTALPFGPTSAGALRATGAPFALVHLSGFL